MALTIPKVKSTARHDKVYYPDSDGKPMAETDVHRNLMFWLIYTLQWHFRDDPLVYVSGNLLLYYEEGNPKKSVAPDCFVVRGVPPGDRRTYLLWEEGVAPCAAFEVSSRSTRREDLHTKPALYARLGIREYFLFDPLAEYLKPPLQGFRLSSGDYVPIVPDTDAGLTSEALRIRLVRAGSRLRLWDLDTGAEILDDRARAARDQARAEQEQARAEQERARAEQEQARAEQERARADAAEAELARLRAELETARRGRP